MINNYKKHITLLIFLALSCVFFSLMHVFNFSVSSSEGRLASVMLQQVIISLLLSFFLSSFIILVIFWPYVSPYFEKLYRFKSFLYQLVRRDFKAKYKRSVLGILWTVLNPLLTMLVLTVVFSTLFRFDIDNFPVYLLSGQVLFTFFSEATTISMASILNGGSMIKKVSVPKYIFPLSRTISSLVNFLLSLISLLLVMVFTGNPFHWTILFAPIAILYTFIFSLGIGLLLSAVTVFFRDVMYLYTILITIVTYLTPIFYPVDIIPDKYSFLISINPLYHLVSFFRTAVIYGGVPSLWQHAVCLLFSIVALVLGTYVFSKKQDEFILYI